MFLRYYVCIVLLISRLLIASETCKAIVYPRCTLTCVIKQLTSDIQSGHLQKSDAFFLGFPNEVINHIFAYVVTNNQKKLGLRGTCKEFERLFLFTIDSISPFYFDLNTQDEQFTHTQSCMLSSLLKKKCLVINTEVSFTDINKSGLQYFFEIVNEQQSTLMLNFNPDHAYGNCKLDSIRAFHTYLKEYTGPIQVNCNVSDYNNESINDLMSTLKNSKTIIKFETSVIAKEVIVDGRQVAEALRNDGKLQVLDIRGCFIVKDNIESMIDALQKNSRLETVSVHFYQINRTTIDLLTQALSKNSALRLLKIKASLYDRGVLSLGFDGIKKLLEKASTSGCKVRIIDQW